MDESLAAYSPDILFRIQYAGSSTPIYLLCEHQSRSSSRMSHWMLRYMLLLLARDQESSPDAMQLQPAASAMEHGGEDGLRVPGGVRDSCNLPSEIAELVKPLAPALSGALNEMIGESIDALSQRGRERRSVCLTERKRAVASRPRRAEGVGGAWATEKQRRDAPQIRVFATEGKPIGALAPQTVLSVWCLGSTKRLVDARSDDEVIEILRGASEVMAQVLRTRPGREAVGLVWRYVLELTEIPLDRLRALLEVELSLSVLEEFMTTAERIRYEAWDRGQRAMLLRLVTRRFGPVPEDVERRIYLAPRTWLDTWAERMFTARVLGEVFKDEDFADEG